MGAGPIMNFSGGLPKSGGGLLWDWLKIAHIPYL